MILDLQNANNHAEFPHATGFRLKQELDTYLYLGPQMDLIGFHEHLTQSNYVWPSGLPWQTLI